MTSPFSVFLRDLLGPGLADHAEALAALGQHPLDHAPGVEFWKLLRGVERLRHIVQHAPLDLGDVVLRQALPSSGRGDVAVHPNPESADQEAVQFLSGLRSQTRFLTALLALLAPDLTITFHPTEGARA